MERPDNIDTQTWDQLSSAEREAIAAPDDDLEPIAQADPPAPAPEPESTPAAEPVAPPEPGAAPPPPPPTETSAPTPAPDPSDPATADRPGPDQTTSSDNAPASPSNPSAVDPYEPPVLVLRPTFEADKAAAQAALETLDQKFNDGEINTVEWARQRDAENAKLTALDKEKDRVDMRIEERNRYLIGQWQSAQNAFLSVPANAEFYKPGSPQMEEIIGLATALGNDQRFANMTHAQFLVELDRRVRPLFAAAAPVAAAPPPPPAAPIRGRAPDLKSVPQSLSAVPAADTVTAQDSEFANVDKLTGLEYEKAIAAMTPAQRERWERAA